MDPQSLDVAVQNTLSGLYPPFDVTAPTVLSQLFRVLEAKYHGDGLCCLLDFLIPSKRLLEHVRQAACAPYFSRVFLHEGWPLCLREKVVVHLGPLNPLLLRTGDFYLQAEPCGAQSACLVVKCLSRDLTTVEKIPVPEASCSLLFTKEWLEEINRDLGRPTLHTCLVATGNGIVPVPWSKIATPEFVDMPKAESVMEQEPWSHPETYHVGDTRGTESNMSGGPQGGADGGLRPTPGKYPGLIKVEQGSWKRSALFVVPSLCDIISENLEGEYVNLLGFSEEGKADAFSPPKPAISAVEEQPPRGPSAKADKGLPWANDGDAAAGGSWTCGKGQNSEEGPCTPCLRRKLSKDPTVHDPRCRYRDSYVAALKNPVSFGPGLMKAILEEMELPREAFPPESADAKPPERSEQVLPRAAPALPNKEGKAEEAAKPGPFRLVKPPTEGATAGNKFSFLKGHRQLGSSPAPEKACKGQPEGPRKRPPAACSPRMARARAAAGKGSDPADSSPSELPALKSSDAAVENVFKDCLPLGSEPRELARWESLRPELLSSGIMCLPGNADKLGRPLVQITTSGKAWQAPWCSAKEVAQLLLHLCSLSRKRLSDAGVTVIIDARKEPPTALLSTALGSVQKALPGSIHTVLLLAEKEAAGHLEKFSGIQVELLSSLKALGRHVDSAQLTPALDGQFPYCHSEWVQYFQKMHPFLGDLRKASELLQSTTKELEKGDAPGTLQDVRQQMERSRQLMQEVLSDAQLVRLQREGGATLARLRKEAARLSFSPDVRSSIDCALALYNLVEEEVHTLVTRSNSRLEHLEFLLRIRELEAEFGKISLWFDKEGESQLREVGSAGRSQENVEEAHRRFKEFFKEASVHYNRGLSLAKEAAKVQGARFPEMEAFEATKRAFQAKLTTFYMDMEMRGAELETLLDLYQFSGKVTQFSLDCRQRLAQGRQGDKELGSSNIWEEAKSLLRRLSEEFSAETFQQMKMQASSLRSEKGLALWNEALERCQEAKQLLEDTAVGSKETQEGNPEGRINAFALPSKMADEVLGLNGVSAKPKKREELLEPNKTNEQDLGAKPAASGSASLEEPWSGRTDKAEGGGEGCYLASPGVILDHGSSEAPDRPAEALGGHSTAALNSSDACPGPKQLPEPCENLPSSGSPCASVPVRGKRGRKKETAHYFQLSRHESFSSEDADSQNSTEDSLGSSATLPLDSAGPKAAWTQEKALSIPYLENHKQAV